MADSDNENEQSPPVGRRQRARPPSIEDDVPVEEAPAQPRRQRRAASVEEAPAQPRRQRRGAPVEEAPVDEAPVEAGEQEEASGAPVRAARARRSARSPAVRRRNLREARRVLAEQGINSENAREAPENGGGGEGGGGEGGGGEGEGGEGGGEGGGGPLGILGTMIKGTVNYLKTDPYQNAFGNDTNEEPYPSLKELYDRVKENPNSPEIQRETMSDFRALKQSYHDAGCDTDIGIALNPKCLGVQAGLYMRLFDIRKSINESLEQMRPIQQQAVLARINREARPEYNGEENVFVPAGV